MNHVRGSTKRLKWNMNTFLTSLERGGGMISDRRLNMLANFIVILFFPNVKNIMAGKKSIIIWFSKIRTLSSTFHVKDRNFLKEWFFGLGRHPESTSKSNSVELRTASISFKAFHRSWGAGMSATVWMVLFNQEVHTRKLGIFCEVM